MSTPCQQLAAIFQSESRIAVLLPTRSRWSLARKSLTSLINTAKFPERIVVTLGIDDDQENEGQELAQWCAQQGISTAIFLTPRLGYSKLHEYNNALAAGVSADFYMIWNDDCVMQTPGWDVLVSRTPWSVGDLHCPNFPPQFRFGTLPIVPRWWRDTLNCISRNAHNDTYIFYIADALGCRRRLPINVLHQRQDDELAQEISDNNVYKTNNFFTQETAELIQQDVVTLARACGFVIVADRIPNAQTA